MCRSGYKNSPNHLLGQNDFLVNIVSHEMHTILFKIYIFKHFKNHNISKLMVFVGLSNVIP